MSNTPRTDALYLNIQQSDPDEAFNNMHDHALRLERELAAARAQERDARRFDYLQNCDPIAAQAFFFNYSSRKQRGKAIDEAIRALADEPAKE